MTNIATELWHEPRVTSASGPVWQDWLLVGVIVCLAGIEIAVRQDIVWRPLAVGLTCAFALTLPWRRLYPVPLIVLVFGANSTVQTYALLNGIEWDGLYTTVLILALPYALLRWGSGKEACAGLAFIGMTLAINVMIDGPPWGEIIGAMVFILFPSTLGASVRYQNAARQRANEQVRMREREQLARELHDTVGHYVSAIAVQAQAGRALAPTRPEAPVEALAVIEGAASRALSEMRSILRAMRGDDSAALAPAASVSDIKHLAQSDSYPFRIRVVLNGDLDEMDSTMASTLFRLTQESITNAVRHARGAENLTVQITGHEDQVHLKIDDDGEAVSGQTPPGLGLRGMTERVSLLGGSLKTGPGEQRGWSVEAILPMDRAGS